MVILVKMKLQGEFPYKAKNFIKSEIKRQRGNEMEDKTWRLVGIKNKNKKKVDPTFIFEFVKRTRPNKNVPRIRIIQNVSVTVSRKFLGW